MQQAAAQSAVEWAQAHPVEWLGEAFDAEVWHMQRLVIESVRDNKRTAVRSCHGIGKSFVAAHIALWFLLTHPNSLVATTAPTFRQVKKILWQEIARATAKAAAAKRKIGGRQLKTEYIIAPGWFAFGFSSDDPTSAQGLHAEHVLLIYDEASGIPAETWEALEGALTSSHTRLLSIGNPTDPTSPFAQEFKTPGSTKFAISAFDTPNFTTFGIVLADILADTWEDKIAGRALPMPWLITPEWVADKVRRWGVDSPAFKSRVLATFPDVGDDTLIPLAWIEAARDREFEPKSGDTKHLVVDVARYGGDENVIGLKHGPRVRVIDAYRGLSTMETAGRTLKARRDEGVDAPVRVDGNGPGGGVVDRLRELSCPVLDMQAGGSPLDDERFLNARAEWFWTLREAFEHGLIDIDETDDDLLGQLSNLKFRVTSSGKIQIESKQEMRKRGLPSPDRADMLAMAVAPAMSKRGGSKLIQAMRTL